MPTKHLRAFLAVPIRSVEEHLQQQVETIKQARNVLEKVMPNPFLLVFLDMQINAYLTLMQGPALCFGFQEHPHPHLRISHPGQ